MSARRQRRRDPITGNEAEYSIVDLVRATRRWPATSCATPSRATSSCGALRSKRCQELLGHATTEMTMRHAHRSPDTRRDAVALLAVNPECAATNMPTDREGRSSG